MDLIGTFENYWQQIAELLPGILVGLAVLLMGWLVARLLRGLLGRLFRSIGLDKASEQLGFDKVLGQIGVRAGLSKVISVLFYWILMLGVLMASANVMGVAAISAALTVFLGYIPKLLTAVMIVLIGALLADRVREAVDTVTRSIGLTGGRIMARILYAIIMVFVVVTALNMAGVDTTLITSNIVLIIGGGLAAFSIAYGFASRDILKNVLSSFYSKDRFRVGQRIKIGEDEGTIEKIDSLTITLNTGDKHVMIPCSELIAQRVELLGDTLQEQLDKPTTEPTKPLNDR